MATFTLDQLYSHWSPWRVTNVEQCADSHVHVVPTL